MSYPAGWDLVTVTGTYVARDGTPCTGSVEFSSPQIVLRSGTVVPAADISFTLDSTGKFTGQVPATDDPNATPINWLYIVTEHVPGGRSGLMISVPHTSTGIDMSTVVPVTQPVPSSPPYPLATLQQLAAESSPTGASLVGFLQPGTGAVGRTVQAKLRDTVSVLDFGAKGDGVADDAPAIQAAINYVCSQGGGTLLLPAGTFKAGSTLQVASGLHLKGVGAQSVIAAAFATPTQGIIESSNTALQSNIVLEDFAVNRSASNSRHGIMLGGCQHLVIRRVSVIGFDSTGGAYSGALGVSAFNEQAQVQSDDVLIEDCYFEETDNFGVAFGNVKNGTLRRCVFDNCYREAIGFEAWSGTVGGVQVNGVLDGCMAYDNQISISTDPSNHTALAAGLQEAAVLGGGGSGGAVIRSGLFRNVINIVNPGNAPQYCGIMATGAASATLSDSMVRDNTIMGAPTQGIHVGVAGYQTTGVVVSGNLIVNPNSIGSASDNDGSAIYADTVSHCVIENNTIQGSGYLHAVWFNNVPASSGNVVRDNMAIGYTAAYSNQPPWSTGTGMLVSAPKRVGFGANSLMYADSFTLAPGTTYTSGGRVSGQRGILILTSSVGGQYAIIALNSNGTPVNIAAASVTSGATDPGTANALTVYPITNGVQFSITNHMTVSANVSVFLFGYEP